MNKFFILYKDLYLRVKDLVIIILCRMLYNNNIFFWLFVYFIFIIYIYIYDNN